MSARRGFAQIIIVAVILLVFVISVFIIRNMFAVRILPVNMPVISESPQPTPSTDVIINDETVYPDSIGANWKTYRNMKYGFEFNYPSKWNVKEKNSTTYDFVTLYENNIADTTGNIGIKLEKIDSQITTDSEALIIFQAFMDSCSSQIPTECTRKNSDDYKLEKQVRIADKIAFQTYGGCCMDFGRHVFLYQNTTSYRFTLLNLGQEGSSLKNEDVFNQILSTFKFTN